MPELPEVDWMVTRLQNWAPNRRIERIEVLRGNYLPDGLKDVQGQTIHQVYRRGKYIAFQLEQGWMVGHNAMSGYWDTAQEPGSFDYVEGSREASENDVRVKIYLPDYTLRYHDARLFGSLVYYPTHDLEAISCLKELGPDAIWTPDTCLLDSRWNVLDAAMAVGGSKKPIKNILMSQEEVAGIGNIYAAEALWRARVSPMRLGKDMNTNDVANVFNAVQAVLREAIHQNLNYTKYLKVYREKTCSNCQSSIKKVKQAGRSTYYCPKCQTL